VADPFPKSRQLARGQRRYRRKVASPKQWQAIIEEKLTGCRLAYTECVGNASICELHHLVPRSMGGDDVADNIVALCRSCHYRISYRHPVPLAALAASLTDGEYAYVIAKLGEGAMQRLFGV
jgi:HNH endonuclease